MRARIRTVRPKIKISQIVRRDLRQAAHKGVADSTQSAKDWTRSTIRSVRLGGLANAIGTSTSLAKRRTSTELAWGALFARGGQDGRANQALMAYTLGAMIYPTGGRKWLAFPTKEAGNTVRLPTPRTGRRRSFGNFKNQPSRYRAAELVFVPVNPKLALLVLRKATVSRATGRAKPFTGKRPRNADRRDGVVMYVLIRFTTRMRRFDQQAIMKRAFATIPRNIQKYQGETIR